MIQYIFPFIFVFFIISPVYAQYFLLDSKCIRINEDSPTDFSNQRITNFSMEEETSASNLNFDNSVIESVELGAFTNLSSCTFRNARILSAGFYGDFFDCDFTRCSIEDSHSLLHLPQENLIQTQNFLDKRIPFRIESENYSGLDFSDFIFEAELLGCCFMNCKLDNAYFMGTIPMMETKRLIATKNYQMGDFWRNRLYITDNENLSLAGMCLRSIGGRVANVDFTDAVFLDGDMRHSQLSLEQIKTTWNYKNNRMNLVQWPKDIQRALNFPERYSKPPAILKSPQGIFSFQPFPPCIMSGNINMEIGYSKDRNLYNIFFSNVIGPLSYPKIIWEQTDNYRWGYFDSITFNNKDAFCSENNALNLSCTVFKMCCFILTDWQKVLLENSVFIDCDLSESKNLTLEQVKSTWNYKNGRMSLSKWPEEILKELEKEKEKSK